MAVSNRARRAVQTAALATAASTFLAACATGPGEDDDEEQVAYCTDENGEIVDDDYCDDGYSGGGLFFLYLGGFRSGLPVGSRLPAGGTRIDPRDSSARQAAGLPGTGKVSGGTRVSGGIGSGVGNRAGTGAGS